MDVRIERAKAKDLARIQKVLHKAHLENRKKGYFFPVSVISRRKLLKKLKRDRYYALKFNGIIVGTVALKRKKKQAEIGSLAVIPKFRSKGLGKKLLKYAEKKATSLGWDRVMLTTLAKHPTLPAFYYRQGYRRTRKIRTKKSKWFILQKRLD